MISRVQNRAEIVNVRGRHDAAAAAARTVRHSASPTDRREQGIVVVVQSGTMSRCLLVDALLHKQEVVIKNLNDMMVHKNRSPSPARQSSATAGSV